MRRSEAWQAAETHARNSNSRSGPASIEAHSQSVTVSADSGAWFRCSQLLPSSKLRHARCPACSICCAACPLLWKVRPIGRCRKADHLLCSHSY